jgi:hypothetical protein
MLRISNRSQCSTSSAYAKHAHQQPIVSGGQEVGTLRPSSIFSQKVQLKQLTGMNFFS